MTSNFRGDRSVPFLKLSPFIRVLERKPIARSLPWLVWLLMLGATYLCWRSARNDSTGDLQDEFDRQSTETITKIKNRMQAYEQVLRGVAAFLATSGEVSRDKFHTYLAALHLDDRYPGIQATGFSPIIPTGTKAAHIARVRAEGFPDYTLRPTGERSLYTPVVYIEPFTGRNLQAFGYDMYAEPVRRAAMERARDSGRTAVCGKVVLLQETEKDVQAGFLMYFPVYRSGRTPPSLIGRRSEIIGWVYFPFRMDDLMKGILGERSSDLNLEIFDGDVMSEDSLMHRSKAVHGQRTGRFKQVTHIDVSGRSWAIVLRSLTAFDERFDAELANAMAACGISISVLLAFIVWLLVNQNARSSAIAQQGETRWTQLMLQANDSILVFDHDLRVIEANQNACKLFGYSIDEICRMHVRELRAPDCVADLPKLLDELDATGSARFETQYWRKDGSIFPAEVSIHLVNLNPGQFVLSIILDISERKRAEEALRSSEERLRVITDSAQIGIIMMDPLGAVIFGIRRQSRHSGTRSEAMGKDLHKLLAPERYQGEYRAAVPEFSRTGNVKALDRTMELSARRKDGCEVAIDLSISRICLNGEWHAIGFVRDITRRKQNEARIAQATDRLTLAVRAGGVGIWAYDRSPKS